MHDTRSCRRQHRHFQHWHRTPFIPHPFLGDLLTRVNSDPGQQDTKHCNAGKTMQRRVSQTRVGQ
eukprot:760579-Pyramimonas_sp.AAC.1